MAYPAWLAEMVAYIKNPHIYMYGMWDSPTPGDVNGPRGPGVPGEGGVDLGSHVGDPVYALASGIIEGAGYWKDQLHGVVTTRVNVPGAGMEDIYYQHINIAPGIKQGGSVTKGELIGTVGSLNEVEVGFNANWGQPWGVNHPGPWIKDPRPWIKALMLNASSGNPNPSNPTNPLISPTNVTLPNDQSTGSGTSGGSPINIDLINSTDLTGIKNWAIKAGIVLTGAIIVVMALALIFKS